MSAFDGFCSAVDDTQKTEYRYERDPDERPSEAIVKAVAAVTGRASVPDGTTGSEPEAGALTPLYETLDPDALDALAIGDDSREANCSVTFTYDDYAVTVRDRTITVAPVG